MTGNNVILHLDGVSKVFNQSQWNEIKAVKKVNLDFMWGESALLIGENASGKTTLLNLISGILDVTEGGITYDNKNIEKLPIYKRAKFLYRIHQNPMAGVAPYGTVSENLALSELTEDGIYSLKRLVTPDKLEKFKEALVSIKPELADKLDHKVYLLSPGQQQALALSLLAMQPDTPPKILLADEPTASLDPESNEKCLKLIASKAGKGWLCIMVTHSSQIIRDHEGRFLKMSQGKIIYDSSNTTSQ